MVAYLALFMAMGGTAYAATGGPFILGHTNKAGQASTLQNTGSGTALHLVTNNGAAPPFTVSNGTKVGKLNADKLDGVDSSQLQRKLPTRLTFTNLALINGWTGGCFLTGSPGVALDRLGVVHFRGAMCNGSNTSAFPFTLPAKYRPSHDIFEPVQTCNSSTGRIRITPTGTVSVHSDANPNDPSQTAQCFTSLAGVSYALPY